MTRTGAIGRTRRLSALWLALLALGFPHGRAAREPAWVKAVLDAGINRAVEVTWEDADGVLYWNVRRNCSESDAHAGATTIRVTEARLLDHRRALNESCSYRVEACDFDGCSPQSFSVSATLGAVPSAPPVVAAWPSQNEIISVRYLPPANAGGGAARVLVTNYRVELSLDAAFSSIAHTTETHDGGIFLQHIRAMKGRRYWVRVTAANAEGWGAPGTFAAGSVRCISTPGPPSDLEVLVAGHLALRIEWRPPLDSGAGDTTEPVLEYLVQAAEVGRAFTALTAARRVQGNETTLVLERLPRTRLTVRVAAANVVGLGPFFTLGSPAAPTPAGQQAHADTAASDDAGPRPSGTVGQGVAVMALPGAPLPLYAGPCGALELCIVFEPPRDTGWPPSSDPSHPLSGGAVGWSLGGGGPLRFRVDASVSPDFTSGVLGSEGEGIVGEEATAREGRLVGDNASDPANFLDVYSSRFVRWRITGLAKGVYYHLRVSAWNGIGWGRPGVLGHPDEMSDEARSTAGGNAGVARQFLADEDAGAPLDGAARWPYYLASAVLPCTGSMTAPSNTAVFPRSVSSPLQRGCGAIRPGTRGLRAFHDSLRVFLRFDDGPAQVSFYHRPMLRVSAPAQPRACLLWPACSRLLACSSLLRV